jgi:hypothetical protein
LGNPWNNHGKIMGRSPNEMEVYSWENLWILVLVKFDHFEADWLVNFMINLYNLSLDQDLGIASWIVGRMMLVIDLNGLCSVWPRSASGILNFSCSDKEGRTTMWILKYSVKVWGKLSHMLVKTIAFCCTISSHINWVYFEKSLKDTGACFAKNWSQQQLTSWYINRYTCTYIHIYIWIYTLYILYVYIYLCIYLYINIYIYMYIAIGYCPFVGLTLVHAKSTQPLWYCQRSQLRGGSSDAHVGVSAHEFLIFHHKPFRIQFTTIPLGT